MANHGIPLCVDLDGTLINTDASFESVYLLLRRRPLSLFSMPFWLLKGRAGFKRIMARYVEVPAALLPYNEEFLDYLRAQKREGRRLILATASDESPARAVAAHVGLFDEVLASDGQSNLIGENKRKALEQRFPEGFDYAGNSAADLAVWAGARRAVVVGDGSLGGRAKAREGVEKTFPRRRGRLAAALRAMRPHQWVKNFLLFVPLITSHQIVKEPVVLPTLLAALSFSLCASAIYVFNDLLDLSSDRAHAAKKRRPFASGDLPLSWGAPLALILLAAGAALSMILPPHFRWVLAAYVALTTAYSLKLKEMLLLDVFCLGGLYTMRILAGHGATGIPLSAWLLAFSMFIFISLALLKRYTEVAALPSGKQAAGRGYKAADAGVLLIMGVASGYLSVLVFSLYINSSQVASLYRHPALLWVVGFTILYLVSRIWLLATRGQVDEDPILFGLKDKTSYAALAFIAAVLVAASL